MSWTIQAQMTFKSSNAATTSLVVADRSVYSVNRTNVATNPGVITPPISGAGTRLMWFPDKSAFRVGTVSSTQWDAVSIGTWSFASGLNTKADGNSSTAMGNNTIASGIGSTAMGNNTIASENSSTAMGSYSTASGVNSTVMGFSSIASGDNSTSMGIGTTASGGSSTAMGYASTAMGYASTAMGYISTANGNYSTAMGRYVTAQSYASLTIGNRNVILGNATSWVATDPIFVIGNGDVSVPSNAFTVLKNGRTAIGFEAPESMLHIKNGDAGAITYYAESNLNVESDANNYISLLSPNNKESGILFGNPSSNVDGGIIYNNSTNKNLQFRTNGNVTRMTLSAAGNLTVTGTVVASCGLLICSDARYKKNITSLNNSLDNILKVKGLRYDLRQAEFPEKNFSDKNQIGFIAQDLEKIFPEMVLRMKRVINPWIMDGLRPCWWRR